MSDPTDLTGLLEAVKRAMRVAYKHRELPPHFRAWLDGEIDYVEFRRLGRANMEDRGWRWVSGEYWPEYLFREGALIIQDGKVAVVWVEEERADPNDPRKSRRVTVPHPAWRRYVEDEERQARFARYADHVAEFYGEVEDALDTY